MNENSEVIRIGKNIIKALKNFSVKHSVRDASSENAIFVQNTFKDSNKTLAAQIQQQKHIHSSLSERNNEPFVAYIETFEAEEKVVYLVCRGYTPSFEPDLPNSFFMNYHSDLGRAVEVEPGESYSTRGANGKISAKNLFKPVRQKGSWDCIQNEFSFPKEKFLIESIIELLAKNEALEKTIEAEKDITRLESLQREHDLLVLEIQKTLQGRRRHLRSRIALRDQQILDTVQGDLFRSNFHSQLAITGGPGTGKTTTVIKRIARQTDISNLKDSNVSIEATSNADSFFHRANWYLYTPTPLLKHYLKENISKEGLPASDESVRVWAEERQIIARDILRILRVKQKSGFIRSKKTPFAVTTNVELNNLSKNFECFYLDKLYEAFNNAIEILTENNTSYEIESFFHSHKHNAAKKDLTFFCSFARAVESLKSSTLPLKGKTIFNELDEKISDNLNNIIDKLLINMPGIITNLCDIIKQTKEITDSYPEVIEDEIDTPNTDGMAIELKAKSLLRNIIRSYSYSIIKENTYNPPKYVKAVFQDIKVHLNDLPNVMLLGKLVSDRRAIMPFSKGYHSILNRIPSYYRDFRNAIIKNENDKSKYDAFDNNRISDTETDMLIYQMLRNAWNITKSDSSLLRAISTNARIDNAIIANLASRYRTQIAIDEVTDFSSLQIGCMCYLCHPQTFSISIVGDLMQRVTNIGIKTWEESQFNDIKFTMATVQKVYRQNPKLLKIASELYKNEIGQEPPFISAFKNDEHDPEPLIYLNESPEKQSEWIAQRISETYLGNQLPTTAIFVSSDDEINKIVELLSDSLEQYSIEVKGCPGGDILGTEGKVAVFSIKYMKGLEFETVFLMNLDTIHKESGDLFDKFLYVGITRAASFLAITCKERFPKSVKYIEHYFLNSDWGNYAEQPIELEN